MTTGGLMIMSVALVCVWGLAFWCYWRVLTAPADDHVVEPPASLGG